MNISNICIRKKAFVFNKKVPLRACEINWPRNMSLFNTYSLAAVSRDIVCRRDKEEIISVKKRQHSWVKYLARTRYWQYRTASLKPTLSWIVELIFMF